MRILIVGAGIGGLTCGIALRRAGFDVEIFERANELAEIGAGISLWPNALAALNELGIEDAVTGAGAEQVLGNIRRPSGEPINIFGAEQMRRYFGGMLVMMHRAELQAVLLQAAEGITINLSARCEGVINEGENVTVQFSGGLTHTADLVVGADGIRSAVRASVDPALARFVGLSAWRAVISGIDPVPDVWLSVGHGKQFLAAPLSNERTYVSGLLPMAEGAMTALPTLGPVLREAFRGWHEPIERLIDATPEDAYIRSDIYDRPRPSRLCWGRVALVGDAAHPVTPDLGQGGCLANEDAVVLARCLQLGGEVPEALHRFEKARLHRVGTIAFDSYWTGKVFASPNPIVGAMRTMVLRGMPTGARLRYLAQYASREAFLKRLPR